MKLRTSVASLGIGFLVGAVWVTLSEPEAAEGFCAAYGRVIQVSDDRIQLGDQVIIDHSYMARDPCGSDDLWHYRSGLGDIDGVLFEDCLVSWADGGRTPADDLGIECMPA